MNELVQQVTQRAGISEDKARTAVDIVVNYLKQKLPGPLGSQIDSALSGGGGVAGSIGDMFGKKSA
ncbi:MAG TPA: hypothetical protein VD837_09835 [Terriglobales bacterium]|nr:hypothetical protein [Terriglobales bacterium]